MQKRGLSTIIVTLILILVSLVAVGIIWVVVRNVIQTGTEGVGLSQFSLSAKILDVSVNDSSNNVSFIVKRNAGKGDLTGISFIFSSNTDTEVITQNISLKELEERRFYFNLNKLNVSNLISISIVPLIKQDEKQITGIALDKYNFGENKNNIPGQTSCVPASNPCGASVCGNVANGTCGQVSCPPGCGGGFNCVSGTCISGIGGPTINLVVSRLSGVAPLGVFFDATGTISSSTISPFHELDYTWNFGDGNSAVWVMSGKSKNTAKGPVAAHIYESAGTYTVNLIVKDINGATSSTSATITVTSEPSGGWTTYCISSSGDFSASECTGATHITTSVFNFTNLIAPNVRILFNRGDTFITNSPIYIYNINGPGLIGAYGTCVNPNERGICENAPLITNTSTFYDLNDNAFITYHKSTDWRIMDLTFTGVGAIGGAIDMNQLLLLKIRGKNANNVGIGNSHWETLGHDQYMIVDSEFNDSGLNVAYVGSERLVLLGNLFNIARTSHVVRVWQAYKSVISNNIMSSSSIDNLNGRHALKFGGPAEGLISSDKVGENLAHRTQYVVISDNLFGSSGPWPVTIGPQDGGQDERLRDIIFERNQLLSNYGIFNNAGISQHLTIWASNVTVRNNIFDGSRTTSGYTGIFVGQRGIEGVPSGVKIYNNVIYTSNQNYNEVYFVDTNTYDITPVTNNIFYAPNDNTGIYAVIGNYNSRTNLFQTNPSFVDEGNLNFHISSSSVARESGTPVPVFDDFDMNSRPQSSAWEIGVYEYV